MRTKDHMALGRLLLEQTEQPALQRHRTAFLLGCVEPDRNPLTYLRGSRRHRLLRGHNAGNSQAYIRWQLDRLERRGVGSAYSCFALGTLLHYIADEFTYAHNESFTGTLREHVRYEHSLSPLFTQELAQQQELPRACGSAEAFLEGSRLAYCAQSHTMQTDCRCIIRVCGVVFGKLTAARASAQLRAGLCTGAG